MLDHGRKFVGPTYPEQLLHLPVFNATSDIGRLIFNVTDGLLYVGKLTGWATLAAGALAGSSGTSGSSGFGSSGTSGTSGSSCTSGTNGLNGTNGTHGSSGILRNFDCMEKCLGNIHIIYN